MKPLILLLTSFLAACSNGLESLIINSVPRPQEPKERLYEVKEVQFKNSFSGNTISGELTYPSTGDSFKAFVLISGRDNGEPATGRNNEVAGHKYFLVISHMLTKRGYAVLRIDNRGVKGSTGNFQTASDSDLATDSAAALNWLRTQSQIDISSSGFLGHSQGGVIALMSAPLERPDYIVSLAGLTLEPPETFYAEQNQRMGTANGMDAGDIEKMTQEIVDIIAILKTSKDLQKAKTNLRDYATKAGLHDEKQIKALFDSFATQWWFDEVKRDSASLVENFNGPILSLYGSKDIWVSASNNKEAVAELFTNPNSESHTFEGVNHLFQTAPKGIGPKEYWEIEQTINEEVIEKIHTWVDSLEFH